MNKLILLFLVFALLAGCTPTEKKDNVPPPPKSPDTATVSPPESAKDIVNNYQKGLVTSVDKARGVQAKVDMGAVQEAVRNFQVENGKYPDSLDAVKSYLRPGTDLGALNYDPGTGTVTIK